MRLAFGAVIVRFGLVSRSVGAVLLGVAVDVRVETANAGDATKSASAVNAIILLVLLFIDFRSARIGKLLTEL